MVEHVPSAVNFRKASMIVAVQRYRLSGRLIGADTHIAVIDDDSSVGKGPGRTGSCGITHFAVMD